VAGNRVKERVTFFHSGRADSTREAGQSAMWRRCGGLRLRREPALPNPAFRQRCLHPIALGGGGGRASCPVLRPGERRTL